MLNYVWSSLMIIAIVTAFFTNRLDAVTIAAMEGAQNGVMLAIELCGAMCLWAGLLRIADKSGLVRKIKKMFIPVLKICFPKLDAKGKAADLICMNMTANLLGMNNAATPLGLAAMKELDKLNGKKESASFEMCMLVIINTASISIFPTTVMTLRAAAGAAPGDILIPCWVASVSSCVVGVTLAHLLRRKYA